MKKLFFLLIAANGALSATAQTHANSYADEYLSNWVIDINAIGGGYMQKSTKAVNTTPNYMNGVNMNTGKLDVKDGGAMGGDIQLGFFFGKSRHWGLGTGFMYLREWNDITLDHFHVEYQSKDDQGFTFRQLLSADNIKERIKTDNYNIPLLLKYKYRFSKNWGFTADAGAVFNIKRETKYSTNASIDYEAIYKFAHNGDGSTTPVYDNAAIPDVTDFMLTRDHYLHNNPEGDVQDYFNDSRNQGYNVGLGVKPKSGKGSVSNTKFSTGLFVQPSLNYFFSDIVALSIGGYFLYQPVANKESKGYMLTNRVGEYSSLTNTVSHSSDLSYGGNLGLRFFLGRNQPPVVITSIEPTFPSMCGTCDGAMTIRGLNPGRPAVVHYNVNGAAQPAWTGTVGEDGTVKLSGLCKGNYTDITATIRKSTANGSPVTLIDPQINIYATTTNPSAGGTCDATITVNGLLENKPVTVSYNLNGAPHAAYTGVVRPDKAIIMTGLCEGAYTGITATIIGCNTTVTDITLTAPAPPPPPTVQEPPVQKVDISTPLLFNFNKATIKETSYPVLQEAVVEMDADNSASLRVDGHADAVGARSYNQVLSVRRAAAVKTYLVRKGINGKRIKVYGHGEDAPATTNDTPEGRAQNRRAVMRLNQK